MPQQYRQGWIYVLRDQENREHEELAVWIERGLSRLQHPVWRRQREGKGLGDKVALERAIERSGLVVVLDSEKLFASEDVLWLLGIAEMWRWPMISVDADGEAPEQRPYSANARLRASEGRKHLVWDLHQGIKRIESVISRADRKPEGRPGSYIFMSYSSKDHAAAEELTEGIEALDIAVWNYGMSPRTENLDYRTEIDQAIRSAHAVIVLQTPDWLKSDDCRRELEVAEHAGRRRIRVLPEDAYGEDPLSDTHGHRWDAILSRLEREIYPSRRRYRSPKLG